MVHLGGSTLVQNPYKIFGGSEKIAYLSIRSYVICMDKRTDNTNYQKRGRLRNKGNDAALRAHLLVEIEREYSSVFKFCKNRTFEYNDVNKFLTGRRSWSLSKTLALLNELGYNKLGLAKEPITSGDWTYIDFDIEQIEEAENEHEKGEKAK